MLKSMSSPRLAALTLCALALASLQAAPTPAPAPTPAAVPLPLPPPVTFDPALLAKPPKVLDGGYAQLDFDRLAGFPFTPVTFDPATAKPGTKPPSSAKQIPATIKKFDGQKALVTGFMLPVKMEGGLVTEFLLVRSPLMCCYGGVPNMNEWVVVKMAKGVKQLMDVPVSCYGKLHVEEQFDAGYLTGIYLLDGEKLTDAKG